MSIQVLVIAALPAAAVFVTAGITSSKFWTSCAAFAAVVVGVMTGDPSYVVIDLLAVAFTTWIVWPNMGKNDKADAASEDGRKLKATGASARAGNGPRLPPGEEVAPRSLAVKRPERFCGACRTLVFPKARSFRRRRCTNCGNVL